MTARRMRVTLACAAAIALALAAVPAAQAPATRVVAIGDVHGSLDGFTSVLRAAGLVNGDGHWTGGTATFVQTGDVTDRGAGVRAVFDLIRRLGPEAEAAGGRVMPVLGNHEVMNLLGELRDVTPEILGSFAGADADKARDAAWRTYSDLVAKRARDRRGEQPLGLTRTKKPSWPRIRAAPSNTGARSAPTAITAAGSHAAHRRQDRPHAVHARGRAAGDHGRRRGAERAGEERTAAHGSFLAKLVAAGLAAPWFRLEDTLAVAAAEVRWVNAAVARAKATGTPPDLAGADPELVQEGAEILKIGEWSLLKGDGPLCTRLGDDGGIGDRRAARHAAGPARRRPAGGGATR
ncbi:MAG: metallophosphoesterase [Vicinamibacterales bacterium]